MLAKCTICVSGLIVEDCDICVYWSQANSSIAPSFMDITVVLVICCMNMYIKLTEQQHDRLGL